MANKIFKEHQRFNQWWLYVFLGGFTCLPMYALYQQFYLGKPFGTKPMPDTGLILFAVFTLLFIYFFLSMRLLTEVSPNGIRFRFIPFVKRSFTWSEMESVQLVTYPFSGYGIKLWTTYGTLYNIRGNKGMAIVLKNGKKLCIGTQQPEKLAEVLKNCNPNTNRDTI